jgi:hypothetical protein
MVFCFLGPSRQHSDPEEVGGRERWPDPDRSGAAAAGGAGERGGGRTGRPLLLQAVPGSGRRFQVSPHGSAFIVAVALASIFLVDSDRIRIRIGIKMMPILMRIWPKISYMLEDPIFLYFYSQLYHFIMFYLSRQRQRCHNFDFWVLKFCGKKN